MGQAELPQGPCGMPCPRVLSMSISLKYVLGQSDRKMLSFTLLLFYFILFYFLVVHRVY